MPWKPIFNQLFTLLYEFLERLRQDYPHILIEGCSGGGGRFDAGMLYYTPQIWCSDNTDAIDRLHIQYGTSFCYPPDTMGAHVSVSPNEQNGRVTPLETRGAVAMCGTFGYEMDLGKLSPEERETVRQQVARFKEYSPLIAKGDYYRLSSPFDGMPYTAWAHISQDRREALATVVWQTVCAAVPFRVLRFKGLDPELCYRVNGEREWRGDVLMQAGYPLPNPWGDYQAIQLHLTAGE